MARNEITLRSFTVTHNHSRNTRIVGVKTETLRKITNTRFQVETVCVPNEYGQSLGYRRDKFTRPVTVNEAKNMVEKLCGSWLADFQETWDNTFGERKVTQEEQEQFRKELVEALETFVPDPVERQRTQVKEKVEARKVKTSRTQSALDELSNLALTLGISL